MMKDYEHNGRFLIRLAAPILCALFLLIMTFWVYGDAVKIDDEGLARTDAVIAMIDELGEDISMVTYDEMWAAKKAYNELNYCEQRRVTNVDILVDAEQRIVSDMSKAESEGYSYLSPPSDIRLLFVYIGGLLLFLTAGCVWSMCQNAHLEAYLCAIVLLMGIGGAYQVLMEGFLKYMILAFAGLAAFTVAYFVGRRHRGFSRNAFVFVLLLIAVCIVANYFLGIDQHGKEGGSRLWLSVAGISIQPGEIVKVLLILLGAASFQSHRRMILYSIAAIGSCGFFVFMGDLGNAAVIFATFLVMTLLLLDKPWLTGLILVIALVGLALVVDESEYASKRFADWFHVMSDRDSQQCQYITACLLGGFDGLGAENSNYFTYRVLPADDGAMAGVMAVYGVPVISLVLLAYAMMITQSVFNYAVRPSAYYIHIQLAVMLFCQVLLAFGGSLDILSFTGIVSPFISRGGSSMLMFGLLFGLGAASLNPNIPPVKSLQRRR